MKSHELARKLLELPDADVYLQYEDYEYGEICSSVEEIWIDIEGDIILAYAKPLDPPTAEEIERRQKQREETEARHRAWEQEEIELQRRIQEEWGHLLP